MRRTIASSTSLKKRDLTVFQTGDFWSNTIRIRPIGSKAEPKTIYTSDKFRANAIFRPDRIYFHTNKDAPNWKVMAAGYATPESTAWTTLIPEQKTVLDDVTVTDGWIVAQDREDVLTRLSVYDKDGKRVRDLPLPVFGNVIASSYDRDTDTLYATLSSHTAPYTVYALGGKTLDWKLIWQDDPPLDMSQIVAERVYVPAKDGAQIPIFIAHRKDFQRNGNNPLLLDGYGGFNNAVAPYYLGSNSAFVNRGGIFVEAGIRGGSEYGERWHEQGMLARKQATFDDMIAVAEWLIAREVHAAGKTRDFRRKQWWPDRRCGHHATSGPVPRGDLPGPAARHGALSQIPDRTLLDSGIRRPCAGRCVSVDPALFAIPEHPARREPA